MLLVCSSIGLRESHAVAVLESVEYVGGDIHKGECKVPCCLI